MTTSIPSTTNSLRRICVYCGSRPGRRESYVQAATALGERFVEEGIGLVYGGGAAGMMGTIADAVLAKKGKVLGVIPSFLTDKEQMHKGVEDMHIVTDMHERKSMMAANADAFIAMPGGLGTMEELFEMLTWSQLKISCKPIGLLNVEGYYDRLVAMIDHYVKEEFVSAEHRDLFVVESDPAALLKALRAQYEKLYAAS